MPNWRERERMLDLSKDEVHAVMETTGIGLLDRLCVPAKHPKRDGFMKVLKCLWGSDSTAYTELGHNAKFARFATVDTRDRISRTGAWFFEDWVILVVSSDDGVPISHIRIPTFRIWGSSL